MKKSELRQQILQLLRQQDPGERFENSAVICRNVLDWKVFQEAKSILFYASLDEEVDTFEMIKAALSLGKFVGLPVTSVEKKQMVPYRIPKLSDCEKGPFGILQPKATCSPMAADQLDLIVVPAVAVDKKRFRLGRGGGYYDRFLAHVSKTIPTLGLVYDFQILDILPSLEPHDVPLQNLISERQAIFS